MSNWLKSCRVDRVEAAAELLRRRKARSNLLSFAQYTYAEYQANWHHRVLCQYLDRFVAGEIKRLMVFQPAQTGKSELVSRRLPAYLLGRDPDTSIITASYASDLASRMNRDLQRIIDSPSYQKLFPGTQLFGKNIRTVADGSYLRNSDIFEVVGRRGVYRSAGVGSGITGMGFNWGIIDDPIKDAMEANSPVVRESVWEWYTSTFLTRRRNENAAILLTVTRWHMDDLPGRLLKLARDDPRTDQWTVVSFPAIAEEPLCEGDPRKIGEPLWPQKFSLGELEKTRAGSGPMQWASMYQQRPYAREGGLFQREWFAFLPAAPVNAKLAKVRYWDLAATEAKKATDPDYTVGVLMARAPDGAFYVLDVRRTRATPANVEALVKQTAEMDGRAVPVIIEQEPGSAGVALISRYVRQVLPGWSVHGDRPTGDKTTRAQPLSAQAEARNVVLLRGEWNIPYLEELEVFPMGAHDDQVDATSGAFAWLTRNQPTRAPQAVGGVQMPGRPPVGQPRAAR